MVLFPFALIWLAIVIVWVVRNEVKPPEERRTWIRRRPRPPRNPRGRPHGTRDRAGGHRASSGSAREPH